MRLWSAIESLPTGAAVEAEWRMLLGDEFDLLRPLFRQQSNLAQSYPGVNGIPLEVIVHSDGSYVGICRETHERIPLRKRDLIVYEADRIAICSRLVTIWGIQQRSKTPDKSETILEVGSLPNGTRTDCLLLIPHSIFEVDEAVARLVTERSDSFILLLPTEQFLRQATLQLANRHGCDILPLQGSIQINSAGTFRSDRKLSELVSSRAKTAAQERERQSFANEFRFDGQIWAVSFNGVTQCEKHYLGMLYIAELLRQKHKPISAQSLRELVSMRRDSRGNGGDPVMDKEGFAHIKKEIEDLQELIQDAKGKHSPGTEKWENRLLELEEQRDANLGLHDRPRHLPTIESRARVAVKNNIARALENMKHKKLAHHLNQFLHTGSSLCYSPNPDVDWVA